MRIFDWSSDLCSSDLAGCHQTKALRPDRKRELVDGMLLDWGVSIRRACRVLPFDTSSYHYQSRRTDPAFLKKRIKEICETHVRYGYRRVYHILRREGWIVNPKKVYRLYRELGLQLRNKTPKRSEESDVTGKSEAVRVDLGGRLIIKKKKRNERTQRNT